MWRIVVNTARDARAGLQRIDGELEELPAAGPADDERRELVRAAVEALPERQRLVVFLRVYADLDYGTIATVMGIQSGTVAATLNAAHAKLRELLSDVRR